MAPRRPDRTKWPSTPSTPSTGFAGTVSWRRYDLLTSPGDVDGDGRPDLVARESLTGDIYLFKGTSTGSLSARTRIGTGWTGYKQIVGAGDLNGDGRTDLVGRDTSGNVWRHNGTGSGSFGSGTKIATGWQGYRAVV